VAHVDDRIKTLAKEIGIGTAAAERLHGKTPEIGAAGTTFWHYLTSVSAKESLRFNQLNLSSWRTVDVVTFHPHEGRDAHGELPGADIALYLARHDVQVDVQRLEGNDIDVGNALLSHAADRDSDLLVMGCYGHSRLREWVLGGATRTILHSMTVPVVMAH
jgi:nucleotide-binding universal stress UspA family protein